MRRQSGQLTRSDLLSAQRYLHGAPEGETLAGFFAFRPAASRSAGPRLFRRAGGAPSAAFRRPLAAASVSLPKPPKPKKARVSADAGARARLGESMHRNKRRADELRSVGAASHGPVSSTGMSITSAT